MDIVDGEWTAGGGGRCRGGRRVSRPCLASPASISAHPVGASWLANEHRPDWGWDVPISCCVSGTSTHTRGMRGGAEKGLPPHKHELSRRGSAKAAGAAGEDYLEGIIAARLCLGSCR